MNTAIGFKLLDRKRHGKLVSQAGDMEWKIGKWYVYPGEIKLCNAGFHCWPSSNQDEYQTYDGIRNNSVIAMVEYLTDGSVKNSFSDKLVSKAMRVLMVRECKPVIGWNASRAVRDTIEEFYL